VTGATDREWNAAAYHRLSGPQFGWGMRVLERLELRGHETVLDAGCGSGRLTAELLRRLPHGQVIAVDQSANMLAEARSRLHPEFGGRVSFVRADLAALHLDRQVDGVFSTATFHWVLDHSRLFASLFQVLRPGGWLVAQCGGRGNLDRLHGRAAALMAQPPFAPAFQGWSEPWIFADPADTRNRLRAAGFVDIEVGLEPAPTPFPSAEEFQEFVETVVLRHHLARLADSNADRLAAQFLKALTAQAAMDDPPYTLDYHRLNLRAHRPD
jgi:trans-aconitate methyltransferase